MTPNQSKTSCDQEPISHWLPDRPTNMLWSGALIRAHCHPDRQTLNLWLTNKLFTVESSYQSSLSPWEDNNIVFRSETLIRAHWLPDRPINMLWSGALIRAHWHPDRQDDQGSLTPWLTTSFCDQELLSELIVTPINKSIESLIDRQNFLHFFWTPWSTDKLLTIRSSYQSLLTPNQSKTSCDQELLSELIDSLIDQQTCYDRELLSELIDTPIDKMIRAHWPPDRSKTSCDQELLSELVDSLIIQQTSCYWGLLSELISSLIDQSLLAIRSSY